MRTPNKFHALQLWFRSEDGLNLRIKAKRGLDLDAVNRKVFELNELLKGNTVPREAGGLEITYAQAHGLDRSGDE